MKTSSKIGGSLGLLVGLTLCAPAFAVDMNSDLKALAAAAQKEGSLDLSWSQSTMSGTQGAVLLEKGMNKAFGTHIKVNFTPGPEMARIGNQLAMEATSGQPAHIDVYMASAAQIAPLVKLDMFLAPDWSKYLPDRIGKDITEDNNHFVRIATGTSGVTYNSQLAPFAPKTMADFLKPAWKGKIATTPYGAGFDVLAADDVWGKAKTLDYVTKLSSQIGGLIRCGDAERLATGEFIALVMDCTGQEAAAWSQKGAPLEQMMPLDAAQERYYYVGVPKNSKHPSAAELFSVFLLTPEGQKLIFQTWDADLHLFPELEVRKQIAKYTAQNAKFKEVTIDWWLRHPEIETNKIDLIKMVTTKH